MKMVTVSGTSCTGIETKQKREEYSIFNIHIERSGVERRGQKKIKEL